MLDIARQLASRRVKENIDARRCIKSKYLNRERDLQQYRFMSPWQATQKFALAYNEFYQRSFARHFDRNAKVQPVDWTEFGKPCRSMIAPLDRSSECRPTWDALWGLPRVLR
ncbi:hypothetical protein [Rhizobium leguminosarum]